MKTTISLWLVLFVVFLDWMGIGLVYPIFSTMIFHPEHSILDPTVSESMRGWYLGILLAVMSISQFFSSPIIGSFSDQKGRRPLFLISLALGIVGYAFCVVGVLIKSLLVLIASRCFVGISAGNAAVVSASIVDLSDESNKAKHFGLYSMACGVGFTVGPFLGGFLSKSHFAIPFCIAGVATFLNLALIYYFFKETHHIRKNAPIRWDEGVRNLKKAFKVRELKALFLTVLFFCFGWSFFYEFIPVAWIANFRFDATKIGFFYAYGAAVYALSSGVLIRPIVGRYKHSSVLFYALFCVGLILLSLLILPSSFWIWIYLPVVNFLMALVYPTSTTLVSDKTSKDAQGEILGILQSVQSAAFAISPLAAGWLLGNGSHMPMLVGGLSMIIGALILGGFLKKEIFVK
ncbi:MAG: MFS transporter [Rhabdochlamydiaceae bacterium]|nr:MFS transporter [Rhabdochlamydiaceae bacterium]